MIWPITHVSPAVDFGFFKKPLPIEVPTPPMGWKSLGASDTPLAGPPLQPSGEDLNKMDPPIDLTGCKDNELFTPHKESLSKLKEVHGGSKWWGSLSAKKAHMDSCGSHKRSKSKSCQSSRTSWGQVG